jgi:methylphosphotriester-DNA--protein-cysteine methyltransferase
MRVILHALVLVLLFVGCGSRFDDKVAVIEKTRSYHRPTCSQVMMARATFETRDEAKRKGYVPCPDCQRDRGLAGKPDQAE